MSVWDIYQVRLALADESLPLLTIIPVFVGIMGGLGVVFVYDAWRGKQRAKGSKWALDDTSRRLPLACVGGPL